MIWCGNGGDFSNAVSFKVVSFFLHAEVELGSDQWTLNMVEALDVQKLG